MEGAWEPYLAPTRLVFVFELKGMLISAGRGISIINSKWKGVFGEQFLGIFIFAVKIGPTAKIFACSPLLKFSLAALVKILINLREIYTRISQTNS